MATVHVYCGSCRSRRGAAIDALVCEHWGRVVLLTPTRELARRRAERVILEHDLPGAWERPILAFQDFVEGLLRSVNIEPRPIEELERRLLLEQVVNTLREEGKLDAVGGAADTGGFLSHMLRTITQIKQAAVEPEAFRDGIQRRKRASWLDPVVADVYAAYQARLRQEGLFDRVGLYWMAELAAREACPPALEGIDALVLDEFDDFTPSEFRLLRTLASHVDTVVFGLGLNQNDPSQADLYSVPLATLGAVRNHFGGAQVTDFEEPAPETVTEFVASHLFWRQPPGGIDGLTPNLELESWPGVVAEVEAIGRRVKSLIVDDGVALDEILIVYRDLRNAAGTFRSVFREFGIPLRLSRAPSLAESAVCVFLMNVLEAVDTWERETVVDVLTSPWFRPGEAGDDGNVGAMGLMARLAHIVAGNGEWTSRLEHLRNRVAAGLDEDDPLKAIADAELILDNALACLGVLEGLSKQLPQRGTMAKYVGALEGMLEPLGVAEALADTAVATEPVRTFEIESLRLLRDVLGRLQTWYEHAPGPSSVTRAEFVSQLRRLLAETEVPGQEAGVACMEAEQARHLRFDYVFYGGVNEGDVPKPPAVSAIYSEQDVQDLRQAGVSLESKHKSAMREMLLFHHMVAAARKRLWLSWHTVSREGGVRNPSPYVLDVQQLLGIGALPTPKATDFVPSADRVASKRDLRNAAFAMQGDALREAFRDELSQAWHGKEIEQKRHSSGAFDAYDGVLDDAALVARIAEDYGTEHQFSVNQLEAYAECPFRFFTERILRVESVDAPVAEFDPMVRGTIMHEVLERFHAGFRGRSIPEIDPGEAAQAMAEALDETFSLRAKRSLTAPPGLVQVEKARLSVTLERYLRIERGRDEGQWKPQHFETSFGKARGKPSDDSLANGQPFALETASGTVLFSGRIDRVDFAEQAARIIDYKTSIHPKARDILAGVALQLPVYALALERHLMPGTRCEEAMLVQVGKRGRLKGLARGGKNGWDKREPAAVNGVSRAVAGIRSGRFAPTPYGGDSCRYCAAKGACRYEPARIERKEEAARGTDA